MSAELLPTAEQALDALAVHLVAQSTEGFICLACHARAAARESIKHDPICPISTLSRTARERWKLGDVVQVLHWMARRYADGRQSYAPSLFNDQVRILQGMGITLNATGDGTVWAADGNPLCRDVTDEQMGPEWSMYQNNIRAVLEREGNLQKQLQQAEKQLATTAKRQVQTYRHRRFPQRAEQLYRGEGIAGREIVLVRVFDEGDLTGGQLLQSDAESFDKSFAPEEVGK